MRVVLWRAADDDLIVDTASFAEEMSTAVAYMDNPGFGGSNLYCVEVEVDPARVLDLAEDPQPEQTLAALLHDEWILVCGLGVDEAVPRWLSDDIAELGYDWVRVPESFPPGTVSWVWIGPEEREPELQEVAY